MDLDNLEQISKADSEGALKVIGDAASQLTFDAAINQPAAGKHDISNIVLSGMGGSCLAGLIAANWLDRDHDLAVPFLVSRDYQLPTFVDKHTLAIIVSVSGNTEETLSSLKDAIQKKAQVVVITTGGKLLEAAQTNNLPYVQIKKISQPRYGIEMHLRAIANILHEYGLVSEAPYEELHRAARPLDDFVASLAANIPTDRNQAKQLALACAGKTPLVYSSRQFSPLAYKWKTSFNENAKNTIWVNEFPEFNHNEFIGWTSHPIEKPFEVINLRSNLDTARINQRFDLSERLLSGHRPAARNIILSGSNYIEQVLLGAALGDFASIYLGLLNGVDPTPVGLVEKFKKELG